MLCCYSRLDHRLQPAAARSDAHAARERRKRHSRQRTLSEPTDGRAWTRSTFPITGRSRMADAFAAVMAWRPCCRSTVAPSMNGEFRPWDIDICWERDDRIASPVRAGIAGASVRVTVGDNQPYNLVTGEDCSLPIHGMRRGWPALAGGVPARPDRDRGCGSKWADILAWRQSGQRSPERIYFKCAFTIRPG